MGTLSAVLIVVTQLATYPKFHDMTSSSIYLVTTILIVACSLLVPCCCYLGARNSDQNLTCCFCGCNCLAGCCSILGVLAVLLIFVGVQWLANNCEPGHSTESQCSRVDDKWTQMCPSLPEGYTAHDCWQYFRNTLVPDLRISFIVFLALGLPSIALQCLSFHWG